MYRLLIIIEQANGNYSTHSPDLPGCVTTGATPEQAERNMQAAIRMQLQGMEEDGLPIPESYSPAGYVTLG